MDNYIGYSDIVPISRKDKLKQPNINSKSKKIFFMKLFILSIIKKIFFYAIINFDCIKLS